MRPFKGIICADVSEFESYMPSQAVPSLWGIPSLQKYMRHPRGFASRHGVSDIQFSEFRPQTRAFPCDSPFELARDRFEGRADGTHAIPVDCPNSLYGLVDGIGVSENVVGRLPIGVFIGGPEACQPERRRVGEGIRPDRSTVSQLPPKHGF